MKRHMRASVVLVVGILVAWGVTRRTWAAEEQSDAAPAADASSSTEAQPGVESQAASPEAEPAGTSSGAAAESGAAASTPSITASSSAAGLISVDFKDADIRQVLRIISLKSGVDIVAGSTVEGLVTIKLTNVPWEQALDIILRTYGFTYEKKGNIVRVMTVEALEQEALSTEVFSLDYAKAKEVPDVLKEMLSDRGKVKFDERTNTVIVTDIPANLFQIKKVIERLDQRTPQVSIETKVVETKLDKSEKLGIEWNQDLTLGQTMPTIQSTFPFTPGASFGTLGAVLGFERAGQRPGSTFALGTLTSSDLSATLNFLQSRTDTHIVSNPNISVLNNHEAKIHIGEEFPIPNYTIDPTTGRTTISGYTAKRIGTVLTVTPHVNPSGEIVTDLKPEVITGAESVSYSTGQNSAIELPRFTVQNAETQVRIRSGETIAIGGLVKSTQVVGVSKVPFFGDLPLVGVLFRNTNRFQGTGSTDPVRQDLIIFLTVKLVQESAPKGQEVAAVPVENAK